MPLASSPPARLVECTFIAIGIVSLLWTFLLGPGWVVGVGNGLILGWLMYRSGPVPQAMALLGLVAGPVLLAGGTAVLLGIIEPDSTLKALAAAPEFVWEVSLGIYLVVKGFKPSPITTAPPSPPHSNSPADHQAGPGPPGPGPGGEEPS